MRVRIEDEEDFDQEDKSIKSVAYQVSESEQSQEIALLITFNDTKAISSNIIEPDSLIVEILRPDLIIDAETFLPLSHKNFEQKLQVGAQLS